MTTRDRTVVMVLAIVAIVVAAWFLAISPKRQEAARLGEAVGAAQQRLQTAQAGAASAEAAKARYDVNYATVARLGKAVPGDDDVPSLVFQLQSAADASKVDFRSIQLSSGAAAAPAAATPSAQVAAVGAATNGKDSKTPPTPAPATPTPPAGATTPAAPAAGAPAAPGAAAPATQAAAATLPPGAAVGAGGFPTMPFDFEFDGSFFRLESFLARLQRFTALDKGRITVRGRLMTVDGFSLTPQPAWPHMAVTMHATSYVVPEAEGPTGGATPAAPGAIGTAQPASANSPSSTPTAAAVATPTP